jgi:hypothetical protein
MYKLRDKNKEKKSFFRLVTTNDNPNIVFGLYDHHNIVYRKIIYMTLYRKSPRLLCSRS